MASYPGSIVSLTNPQGTNLLTSPDHGALHTSENNEIVALESLLGTTAASNGLFNSYTSGQTPLSIQSGTIGSIISKGTINTSVFGTNQYTGGTLGTLNLIGGTIAGQIQNNGTIANGVYGTVQITGGTIGTTTVLQPLQSAFMAQPGTAGQVLGTNALIQINFGTLSYDLLSEFGTANNNFIAKSAGLYYFGFSVNPGGGGGNAFSCQIRLNGTTQISTLNGTAVGNSNTFWQGSVPSGGTIDCAIMNNSTTTPGTIGNNQGTATFWGKRIF